MYTNTSFIESTLKIIQAKNNFKKDKRYVSGNPAGSIISVKFELMLNDAELTSLATELKLMKAEINFKFDSLKKR